MEGGPSLKDLKQKIDKAQEKKRREEHVSEPEKGPNPYTIVVEFVAGTLLGVFLGHHLDKWLETSPIFLLLCTFLGLAAALLTIYKEATNDEP